MTFARSIALQAWYDAMSGALNILMVLIDDAGFGNDEAEQVEPAVTRAVRRRSAQPRGGTNRRRRARSPTPGRRWPSAPRRPTLASDRDVEAPWRGAVRKCGGGTQSIQNTPQRSPRPVRTRCERLDVSDVGDPDETDRQAVISALQTAAQGQWPAAVDAVRPLAESGDPVATAYCLSRLRGALVGGYLSSRRTAGHAGA